MHLCDRGGGDRFAEADEDAVDRLPEGRLNRRDRDLARKRRHAVLQQLQMAHHIGADDIRTRRQKLAELDVGRPQSADRGGEIAQAALRAAGGGESGDQLGQGQRRARGGRHQHWVDVAEDAGAGEDETRARQAEHGAEGENHARALKLPAGMDGDDAPGQPGEVGAVESRRGDLFAKTLGARKARDRFDEIAVGIGVARHPFANARDGVE